MSGCPESWLYAIQAYRTPPTKLPRLQHRLCSFPNLGRWKTEFNRIFVTYNQFVWAKLLRPKTGVSICLLGSSYPSFVPPVRNFYVLFRRQRLELADEHHPAIRSTYSLAAPLSRIGLIYQMQEWFRDCSTRCPFSSALRCPHTTKRPGLRPLLCYRDRIHSRNGKRVSIPRRRIIRSRLRPSPLPSRCHAGETSWSTVYADQSEETNLCSSPRSFLFGDLLKYWRLGESSVLHSLQRTPFPNG